MAGSSWRKTKVRPPPPPPIPEPSKLREYSDEHLTYEVEMLWLAATHPPPDPNTPQDAKTQFISNAQAEAFALHLRNLIVFLYPDRFPLKDDDVSAHHFLDSESPYEHWLQHRPVLSSALERAKSRADKELAHLTTARIAGTPPVKRWDPCALLRELNSVLASFATCADPNRLGDRARAAIAGLAEGVTRYCREGAA
jgi:hypothetical protein